MHSLNRRRTILVFFLALAVAGGLVVAVTGHDPAGALTLAQKKAIAKAKAKRIKHVLALLDTNLSRAVEEYNLANIKLADAEARLHEATQKLSVARYELGVARDTLSDRVVSIYKQRPTDFMDIFFASRSFEDLTSDLRAFQRIGENDSRIVDQVEAKEVRVEDLRTRRIVERRNARVALADVTQRKTAIENTIAQRTELLHGVNKQIASIEKEQRRLARLAAARAAAAAAAAASMNGWTNPRPLTGDPGKGHPEVIAIAKRYLGVPYVYGAADPNVGFDCSGLVMYCYAQIGISLPHYSGYQQNLGVPVALTALVPGDLVFMGYPVSYHVGMYAGNGLVIEAPHTGDVVKFCPLAGWQYAVRIP